MIRNIWAVGRNYADHAKELGNAVPTEPLIFLKAGSTVVQADQFHLPRWGGEIHHELELALRFDKDLKFSEGAIALDLTDRTAQAALKAKGYPWTLAKSFKESTPLSAFFPIQENEISNLKLVLTVNGSVRQEGHTADMIFSVSTLREYILERFPVEPGDLLLTGTPPGVGPLQAGDKVHAQILGKAEHFWQVR